MSTPAPDPVTDALIKSVVRQRNAAMDQIANLEAALTVLQAQLQAAHQQLQTLAPSEQSNAADVP